MMGTTALHHLGIVVEDVTRSAEAFSALTGIPVPAFREFNLDDLRARDVRYLDAPVEGGTRAASFALENVVVDLLEPAGGASPWRDFLEQHGPGPEHLAFVMDNPEAVLAGLGDAGYRIVQSGTAPSGSGYGYVEALDRLGLSLEILPLLPERTLEGATPTDLGTWRIAQVGVVTEDIGATLPVYEELLVLKPRPLRTPESHPARNLRHRGVPSGGQSTRTAFELDNLRLELVQPSGGPTSWGDVLAERSPALHHIAFEVDDFERAMRFLDGLGYPETHYGDFDQGHYAYVDARPDLAIHLEVIHRTRGLGYPGRRSRGGRVMS